MEKQERNTSHQNIYLVFPFPHFSASAESSLLIMHICLIVKFVFYAQSIN